MICRPLGPMGPDCRRMGVVGGCGVGRLLMTFISWMGWCFSFVSASVFVKLLYLKGWNDGKAKMERTDFLDRIFAKIKKSLNRSGVVSMQCCSEFDLETRRLLKELLPKYFKKIKYQSVFIPSFCENWTFASAEEK